MGKYHNKIAEVDGIRFDSHKEANYYCLLKMLQRGGDVVSFRRQVPYELQPKFTAFDGSAVRAVRYVADFVVEYADGHSEVVDVKGFKTKDYLLKKKMFLYKFRTLRFVEV